MQKNVYYAHNVCDNPEENLKDITMAPDEFRSFLDLQRRKGQTAKDINDLTTQELEGAYAITFDDGFRSIYNNVHPICEKRKVPYCIFITTGYISGTCSDIFSRSKLLMDRIPFLSRYYAKKIVKYTGWPNVRKKANNTNQKKYMKWGELEELVESDLVTIGSHSVSHINHAVAGRHRLEKEIAISKKILEDKLGITVKHYSYPFGSYTRRVMDTVKKKGYKYAFRTDTKKAGYKEDDEKYQLRRLSIKKYLK